MSVLQIILPDCICTLLALNSPPLPRRHKALSPILSPLSSKVGLYTVMSWLILSKHFKGRKCHLPCILRRMFSSLFDPNRVLQGLSLWPGLFYSVLLMALSPLIPSLKYPRPLHTLTFSVCLLQWLYRHLGSEPHSSKLKTIDFKQRAGYFSRKMDFIQKQQRI